MEHQPGAGTRDVLLREVRESDLPIFFENQLDPDANRVGGFTPRDRQAFMEHWTARVLGDETVIKKTVLFEGEVAGNVVSFERAGKREVGYWIGRKFWGKGVATRALAQLLDHVTARPLYAVVAAQNVASIRCWRSAASGSRTRRSDLQTIATTTSRRSS
jgi:RimJ/RimL family protein N-acetyltransferase